MSSVPLERSFSPVLSFPSSDTTLLSGKSHLSKEAASPFQLEKNIFVGREREMEVLRTGLQETFSGCGRLFLLVGEPGIGKTRAANEFAMHARMQGAHVLIGRCHEGDGAPPFWPWVQIVRSYVRSCNPEALRKEMGAGAADIAHVMSEVREQLSDLPPLPTREPEQARFRFFDSLTLFLKNAGRVRPLVLILDDLHWADKPSLLLLQFLARELGDAHLLLIGTYRDMAVGRNHPLAETLAELARVQGSQRILLRGLTKHDVARFLAIAAATTPSETLITTVYNKTEGNPFFLNAIVRLLITNGRTERTNQEISRSFPLPRSVHDVICHRLSPLSQECNNMLSIAAVIGREFRIDVLERVTKKTSEHILNVLEEALSIRVIMEARRAVGCYSFSHALIQEALYEELPAIRRVQLHGVIGETLEDLYKERLQASFSTGSGRALTELAYHFFEAARGGKHGEKSIVYAIRAGAQAMSLLAYEEAVSHYQRALQALDFNGGNDLQRCESFLALGEAQTKAGNTSQAREDFQRAATLARQLGAPEHFARSVLGFEKMGVEVGMVNKALVTLLEEALDILEKEESALRARVLARLAQELYFSTTSAARRAFLSQQAVAMARRVGDPAALAAALDSRRLALWGTANVQERLATITEMLRLAEEAGDKERTMRGRADRVADLLELGDILAVDSEIAIYTQLAEELRQPRYWWNVATFRAMRALLTGRFAEAEQFALQALSIGQRVESQTAANFFGVQMFSLRREQGRLHELEAAVQGFVQQYPAVPAWRSALTNLYSETGREAEARSEFEYMAANNFADLPQDNSWLIGITLLSEVCAFLVDSCRAATLYELLLPYAGHNVIVGDAAACNGSVSRNLGLLATTLGRWEEALQHFEDALAMNRHMGAKPFVARTQYEYAKMFLTRAQSGDREKARDLLIQALHTAQELQMKSLEERIQELRVSPAPNPQHPTPNTQHPDPNVFRREGDYWTLVYRGITCQLKNVKGLHYIAFLLRYPDREFHASELVTAVGKQQAVSSLANSSTLSETHFIESSLTAGGLGDSGELLDTQAKAAYRYRLEELREELETAECFHDPDRIAKVQAEIDFLTNELSAALGLNGRDRKAASVAERARLNVTKAIKATLNKMSQHHPALGYYLSTHIKTGIFCSYMPDPTQPAVWTL